MIAKDIALFLCLLVLPASLFQVRAGTVSHPAFVADHSDWAKRKLESNLKNKITAGNQFIAKTLGSNMVLQRDVSASIYGFSSSASNTINVMFQDTTYTTLSSSTAATDGGYFWQINLPVMPGGFNAYKILIYSSTGESAVLENVVFGEVFLCSGQR